MNCPGIFSDDFRKRQLQMTDGDSKCLNSCSTAHQKRSFIQSRGGELIGPLIKRVSRIKELDKSHRNQAIVANTNNHLSELALLLVGNKNLNLYCISKYQPRESVLSYHQVLLIKSNLMIIVKLLDAF